MLLHGTETKKLGTAFSVSGLTVMYGTTLALEDATFCLNAGTMTAVVGPNGSGKTSLVKGILGLVEPVKGEVHFRGKNLDAVRPDVAYVPQRKDIDWDFPITVSQMVLLGTYPRLKGRQRPRAAEREWALKCLERVGMAEYGGRQIGQLSGGQQQRVFLARALAQRPHYLFLDEPFTGVDASSQETSMRVLNEMARAGVTILAVHHDLDQVRSSFEQVIMVNQRILAIGPPSSVLSAQFVAEAYSANDRSLSAVGGGAVY